MIKDFQKWHNKKEILNEREDAKNIFFREKDVWWVALGVNIGFEQDGKGSEFRRPVLILKKFNPTIFLAVPLTTRIKSNKYYVPIDLGDKISRTVIISQIRLIDSKRLIDKLGNLRKNEFVRIKKAIKDML
jgi:mRNA interferase MazF